MMSVILEFILFGWIAGVLTRPILSFSWKYYKMKRELSERYKDV